MKKKILLTLMVIVLGILVYSVTSASAESYENFFYCLSDGEITIIGCDSSATTVDIPSTIAGREVTSIGDSAFKNCENLTSVTLPDTLKTIGDSAFQNCYNLNKIVIPNSVEYLGAKAFYMSGLASVTIGTGISELQSSTFSSTNLTSVTVPGNVKKIYPYTFASCYSLSSITLQEGVENIEEDAFANCFYIRTIRMPKSVKAIGSGAFCYWMYGCPTRTVYIADIAAWCNIDFEDETAFELAYATMYCNSKNLSKLVIPDGVETIKNYAFYGFRMSSISIPKSVKTIGCDTFTHYPHDTFVSALKIVTWDAENASVEDGWPAFSGHENIETLIIGKNVKSTDFIDYVGEVKTIEVNSSNSMFSSDSTGVLFDKNKTKLIKFPAKCESVDYAVPEGVLTIGVFAFYNCMNLEAVSIPDSVNHIEKNAFEGCSNIEALFIGKGLSKIDSGAFSYTYISSVYIEDMVAWCEIDIASNPISYNLFLNEQKVTTLNIPSTVTQIKDNTFCNCKSITTINVPSSVVSIGNYAFKGCTNLYQINVDAENPNYTSQDGYLYTKDRKNLILCSPGIGITDYAVPSDVVTIGDYAFADCGRLKTVTIHDKVTHIGERAFYSVNTLYYNGTMKRYNEVVAENAFYYTPAELINFWYVEFVDESGKRIDTIKNRIGTNIDTSCVDVEGHKTLLHLDDSYETQIDKNYVVESNITVYVKNQVGYYTHKFVNYDGSIIHEETVEYGTKIYPPDITPERNADVQYTYDFKSWRDFDDGITQKAEEMVFTAEYSKQLNQYTYKFLDDDGMVLSEISDGYGAVINPPVNPADKDPYTFDFWQGYSENMTLKSNVTFTAVYKSKNYKIYIDGLFEPEIVSYGENFELTPGESIDGYEFIGYYTEKNGNGEKFTNEKGESLKPYHVVGDKTVYPYFVATYMNSFEVYGTQFAIPGSTISQKAIFATHKNVQYVIVTIKYPKFINFKSIKPIDFVEVSKESEKNVDEYKYLEIVCIYDYEGNFAPINQNLIPFEVEFDISTSAPVGNAEISLENVLLFGEENYTVLDTTNHIIEINPKFAEIIEIVGDAEIDKPTQYKVVVLPDYTTDKSVVWSVNDETVATISQDGTVTPVKNGTVIITATAKDGSEVFATKTVNVIAYAKINSLDFDGGVVLTEFNPEIRKYTVYVKEDTTSISLRPTFSGGGVLRSNGSGVWISGRSKDFEINDTITTITLNRDNVIDMTNSVYTIEVVKYEGTKTEVSEDKKSFTITPINIENGKTVILALYNGEKFVEMRSAVYTGEAVPFTTTKTYTKAKVMVWDDLTNLKPICEVEIIE